MTDSRPRWGTGARNRLTSQACGNASARAAAQLPYTSLTVLADGHTACCSRARAFGPRLLAWVHDQSYEEGSLPYCASHASIASRTRSRVHCRAIAPG